MLAMILYSLQASIPHIIWGLSESFVLGRIIHRNEITESLYNKNCPFALLFGEYKKTGQDTRGILARLRSKTRENFCWLG